MCHKGIWWLQQSRSLQFLSTEKLRKLNGGAGRKSQAQSRRDRMERGNSQHHSNRQTLNTKTKSALRWPGSMTEAWAERVFTTDSTWVKGTEFLRVSCQHSDTEKLMPGTLNSPFWQTVYLIRQFFGRVLWGKRPGFVYFDWLECMGIMTANKMFNCL